MKRSLLLFALLLPSTVFAADAQAPLQRTGTIALPDIEGRIDHFTVDLQHHIVYIAALGADTVLSVDVTRGKVLGRITGLSEPQGLLYVPENGHLFIANGGDGSVRIYDGGTLQPLKRIELGDDADNIRYDAAQKTVWIGYGNGALAALDINGKKLFDIPIGGHPESFVLAEHGSRIFVNVPRNKQVAVVDRTTEKVVATYTTGTDLSNYPMAFDETGARLFLGCRQPARLLVLNAATGTPVADLDTVTNTDDLFYDATRRRVYVLGGGGYVVIYSQLSVDNYAELSRMPTAPGGRTGLFVPAWNELLVAVPHINTQNAALQIYKPQ